MSFSKKSDVKKHLSSRHHGGIHLYRLVSQPDATGFPGEELVNPDKESDRVVDVPKTATNESESVSRKAEVLDISKTAQK